MKFYHTLCSKSHVIKGVYWILLGISDSWGLLELLFILSIKIKGVSEQHKQKHMALSGKAMYITLFT